MRFGLIGHGRFGKHYERLLREIPGAELTAIASLETSITAKDIFVDPTIDAVVIATPPSTHAGFMRDALASGKHVLVEKPMVVSVAEAEALRSVVASSGRVVMVGFQYLYHDYIHALKSEIARLGRVSYVVGELLYPGPIREDVGCFVDASAHDLSIIEYLFSPGPVASAVGKQIFSTNKTRDDFTAATVTYESGLVAHLMTSWIAPEKVRRFTVVGEHGGVVFDDQRPDKLKWSDGSVTKVEASEPLRNELEHFIHCVKTGEEPITNFNLGSRVVAACESIVRNL